MDKKGRELAENERGDSNNSTENQESGKNIKRDENTLIDNIIEQIYRRQALLNKKKVLNQKLAVFISQSTDKEYLLNVNSSGEGDEWSLRLLIDNIIAKDDELYAISQKDLEGRESIKKEICEKKESLKKQAASFKELKQKTALISVNSETGEKASVKDVEQLINQEEELSQALQESQLYSIQKRHNLNIALEKKKNLAQGKIDFAKYEMMCIETQNNKAILQPMSEEIKNFQKKTSDMINVLSHMGQKMYLAQQEKLKFASTEKELQKDIDEMRDDLFKERMNYNKMKKESKELQQKFRLLQHPGLLDDYNAVLQKNEEARKELQTLKTIHEDLTEVLSKQKTR